MVVQRALAAHQQVATAGEGAALAVIEVGGGDGETVAAGQHAGVAVVQRASGEGQAVAGKDLAALVEQRPGGKCEGTVAGNLATLVVDAGDIAQDQLPWATKQAADVVQHAALQVEIDAGLADQLAAAVLVEAGNTTVDGTTGGQAAALTVVQLSGGEVDGGVGDDATVLAVVELRSLQADVSCRADNTASVVQVSAAQVDAGVAEQLAAPVVQGSGQAGE
ncbi:hypothetical protein D9M71_56300 [compost metagenome]